MPGQSWFCYKSWKGEKADQMNLRKKLEDLLQPSTSGPQLRQLRSDYDQAHPGNILVRHLRFTQKPMNPEEWLVDPATKKVHGGARNRLVVYTRNSKARSEAAMKKLKETSPFKNTEMGARCTCCQESAQSLDSGARHWYDWDGVYFPVCIRRRCGGGLVPTRRKSCRWTAVAARHGSRIANGCSCAGCSRNRV